MQNIVCNLYLDSLRTLAACSVSGLSADNVCRCGVGFQQLSEFTETDLKTRWGLSCLFSIFFTFFKIVLKFLWSMDL
jgi:hypothetical protein